MHSGLQLLLKVIGDFLRHFNIPSDVKFLKKSSKKVYWRGKTKATGRVPAIGDTRVQLFHLLVLRKSRSGYGIEAFAADKKVVDVIT